MPRIINSLGEDITDMVVSAAKAYDLPVEGLLGLLIAESNLNPYAQRFGKETREAMRLIESLEAYDKLPVGEASKERRAKVVADLMNLIASEWPDISFGMSQRIVLYHYWGDRTSNIGNILNVRKAVFANPARDIMEAAKRYKVGVNAAGGLPNPLLMGMVHYNHGSIPPANHHYWLVYADNVRRYQGALEEARKRLEA